MTRINACRVVPVIQFLRDLAITHHATRIRGCVFLKHAGFSKEHGSGISDVVIIVRFLGQGRRFVRRGYDVLVFMVVLDRRGEGGGACHLQGGSNMTGTDCV